MVNTQHQPGIKILTIDSGNLGNITSLEIIKTLSVHTEKQVN